MRFSDNVGIEGTTFSSETSLCMKGGPACDPEDDMAASCDTGGDLIPIGGIVDLIILLCCCSPCIVGGVCLGSSIWGQRLGSEGMKLIELERGVWFPWKRY